MTQQFRLSIFTDFRYHLPINYRFLSIDYSGTTFNNAVFKWFWTIFLLGAPDYLKWAWLENWKLKSSVFYYGQHHDSTDSYMYMARIDAGMSVELARHKLINMALDLTWPQLPPPFKRSCVWEEGLAVHKLGSKESNSSIIPRQTYIFCYHQSCTTFQIYKLLEIDTGERLNRHNISKQFLLSFHRGTQQRYVYITLSSIRFFQEKRMLPNGNM